MELSSFDREDNSNELCTPRTDICTLSTARRSVSGEPVEMLHRWAHSGCVVFRAKGSHDECSILIFGGYGGLQRHSRTNDLLELNISTMSLSSLNADGAPLPMMAHSAALVDESMVIIGGREAPHKPLHTVQVLNVQTLQWWTPQVLGAKFVPRHRHASVRIGFNVFVFGGMTGRDILSDLYMLNCISWEWLLIRCIGEVPSARHSHGLAAVGNKIFLFGGCDADTVYGDLHVLNLDTHTWVRGQASGKPPRPRFSHTLTAVGSYLTVIGGCPITGQEQHLDILDVVNMMWIQVPIDWPCDLFLVRHSVHVFGSSLVIIGGGASCYAFGTKFSPPFTIDLEPFLLLVKAKINLQENVCTPSKNLSMHMDMTSLCWVLKLDKTSAKPGKDALKELNWFVPGRQAKVDNFGSHVCFPITNEAAQALHKCTPSDNEGPVYVHTRGDWPFSSEAFQRLITCKGETIRLELPTSTKQPTPPSVALQAAVSTLLERRGLPKSLLQELPSRWERLGDMVVLPSGCIKSSMWHTLGKELWEVIASSLRAQRLARQAPIAATGTRDSKLQLLLGVEGWVQHRENGILYCFDATKCMFSSGNVSEKLRIGNAKCQGKTVVDLYAGIGYFVLPFLVKAGAQTVYACEWNPHAVTALRHNLHVNGVEDRCKVLEGDNQITAPQGVADIVSLGLLPTSEASWPVAVRALRPAGGVLLVHGNVKDSEENKWVDVVLASIQQLASSLERLWDVSVTHVERVKWYAPHIRHVVVQVCCKLR